MEKDKESTVFPMQQDDLLDAVRRYRRSFFLFWLVLFVFVTTLGWLVVDRHLKLQALVTQQQRPPPLPAEMTYRGGMVIDLEGGLQGQLVVDELMRLEPTPVPEGGIETLSVEWIKQAAYQLLQGEQAYDRGQWAEAVRFYEEALKIFPGMKGVQARLALCHTRSGDYGLAREAFASALEETPDSHRIMNNLAVTAMAEEAYEEAEALLLRVMEIDPDYLPSYYNIGLLYTRTGEPAKAEPNLRRYLDEGSIEVDSVLIYTRVLIDLERWDQAANLLQRTAAALPKAVPVHLKLAEVLARTPNHDEAMSALQRGVSMLDRTRALAILSKSEYDPLRNRSDFRALVSRLGEEPM